MAENDDNPLYGARIEWPSAATVFYRTILYLIAIGLGIGCVYMVTL